MKRRIVVKIGSNVLTRTDGKLDVTRVSALVDQVAWLRQQGHEVILVSSGAVACGRRELKVDHLLDSVEQRQLFSALGQVKLIGLYYDLFREYHIHVGQVLTMKENFQSGELFENQRACMRVMLENGVLPIVNENDTVCVTELMFTDNDELSGLIAEMMQADTLILLQVEKSSFGRGGMHSKYTTAVRLQREGVHVIIANGKREGVLVKLMTTPDNTPHTSFETNLL